MPCSQTPGKQYSEGSFTLYRVDFCSFDGIVLPVFTSVEAQSLQLALTAYQLAQSVLNLWDYSRWPKVRYPVVGLPCWDGIRTRWNN